MAWCMSDFYFYMKVKPFLGQWLKKHYGDPVRFPARSAENACIRRMVSLRPKDWVWKKPEGDVVAVAIPNQHNKKVEYWNYMSRSAQGALMEIVEDTFRMQFYKDMNELARKGVGLLRSVRIWCEQNGISSDYDYTLKMRYQRMRESYLKHGIDLRKRERGHNRGF